MQLKLLSYDIEVLPKSNGNFPTPDRDPVIMISYAGNFPILNGINKAVFILNRNLNTNRKEEMRNDYILIRVQNEEQLIKEWINLIKDCDINLSFNGTGFDFPYLIDRSRILRIPLRIGLTNDSLWYDKRVSKGLSIGTINGAKGKIIFDILNVLRRSDESNVLKKQFNLKSLKLEHVSKEILGEEESKLKFGPNEMLKWYRTGERENDFIEYGKRDAEIPLELTQRFRLLDRFLMLSRRSGKLLQDVLDSQGFGGMVENLLMKEYFKNNRLIPCRKKSEYSISLNDTEQELEGAFVLEPKLGITDNLASCDYSSLYPSLHIRHNICFTTLIQQKTDINTNNDKINIIENENKTTTYGMFVKPEVLKGIIPQLLESLLEERKFLKSQMKKYEKGTPEYIQFDQSQNAAKILLNSMYGYTGDINSRLYSWNVASSVTGAGRNRIINTIDTIDKSIINYNNNTYKLKTVLGDTDSSYVQVIPLNRNENIDRDTVVYCMNQVLEQINKTLQKPMNLSFESYIKRILVTAKKHYTYLSVDNGKEHITNKGIEVVRRDWCNFASNNMKQVLEYLLKEQNIQTGMDKSKKYIQNTINELRRGKTPVKELILSKKLSKPLTSYDTKAIHWQVAKNMMERGKKVEIGDRISYLIMNNGKKLISEKAEDADYVMEGKSEYKIDYDYYVYDQLLPPVERIFNVLGTSIQNIEYANQKTLFDY